MPPGGSDSVSSNVPALTILTPAELQMEIDLRNEKQRLASMTNSDRRDEVSRFADVLDQKFKELTEENEKLLEKEAQIEEKRAAAELAAGRLEEKERRVEKKLKTVAWVKKVPASPPAQTSPATTIPAGGVFKAPAPVSTKPGPKPWQKQNTKGDTKPRPARVQCGLCWKYNHVAADCKTCRFCGKSGHRPEFCFSNPEYIEKERLQQASRAARIAAITAPQPDGPLLKPHPKPAPPVPAAWASVISPAPIPIDSSFPALPAQSSVSAAQPRKFYAAPSGAGKSHFIARNPRFRDMDSVITFPPEFRWFDTPGAIQKQYPISLAAVQAWLNGPADGLIGLYVDTFDMASGVVLPPPEVHKQRLATRTKDSGQPTLEDWPKISVSRDEMLLNAALIDVPVFTDFHEIPVPPLPAQRAPHTLPLSGVSPLVRDQLGVEDEMQQGIQDAELDLARAQNEEIIDQLDETHVSYLPPGENDPDDEQDPGEDTSSDLSPTSSTYEQPEVYDPPALPDELFIVEIERPKPRTIKQMLYDLWSWTSLRTSLRYLAVACLVAYGFYQIRLVCNAYRDLDFDTPIWRPVEKTKLKPGLAALTLGGLKCLKHKGAEKRAAVFKWRLFNPLWYLTDSFDYGRRVRAKAQGVGPAPKPLSLLWSQFKSKDMLVPEYTPKKVKLDKLPEPGPLLLVADRHLPLYTMRETARLEAHADEIPTWRSWTSSLSQITQRPTRFVKWVVGTTWHALCRNTVALVTNLSFPSKIPGLFVLSWALCAITSLCYKALLYHEFVSEQARRTPDLLKITASTKIVGTERDKRRLSDRDRKCLIGSLVELDYLYYHNSVLAPFTSLPAVFQSAAHDLQLAPPWPGQPKDIISTTFMNEGRGRGFYFRPAAPLHTDLSHIDFVDMSNQLFDVDGCAVSLATQKIMSHQRTFARTHLFQIEAPLRTSSTVTESMTLKSTLPMTQSNLTSQSGHGKPEVKLH